MRLELPPIEQSWVTGIDRDVLLIDPETLQSYARAAQRMALEEAAKVCESRQFVDYKGVKLEYGPEIDDANGMLDECASAIRKLAEQC